MRFWHAHILATRNYKTIPAADTRTNMRTTSLFVTVATLATSYVEAGFVTTANTNIESTRPAFVGTTSALHVATLPEITSGARYEADETPFFASLTKDMLQDQAKSSKTKAYDGPLAPVVVALRDVIGQERFNKLRGNAISLHSTAIRSFVGTSESSLGEFVLKMLFLAADKDEDGLIREAEMKDVLQGLGFTWLEESQIAAIFKRANVKIPNHISLEEFVKEAPRTLSTNLVKLAKKNGGALGLLA